MIEKITFFLTISFISVLSNLDVYIPECAQKFIRKPINYTLSNFGHIPYGQTYIGNLIKPSQANAQLCNTQNQPPVFSTGKKIFMLIQRGNCKFTQKVLNAQKLGVDMAVIYDNESINNNSQNAHLIMKNDGHGHLVTIPSLFISKISGQKLEQALKQCHESLVLKQIFDVFETQVVTLSLWLNLNNRQSYVLLRDFYQKDYYNVLKDYVNLSVRYSFLQKIRFKVNYGCQLLFCQEQDCLGNTQNQYCLPIERSPTKFQADEILSGSELLLQSLRMYLLFEMLPQSKDQIWFLYMDLFDSNICFEKQDIEECSYNVMKQSGVSIDLIQAIQASVYQNLKKINSKSFNQDNILFMISNEADQKNIQFYPQAVINGKNFYGLFKAPDVFDMICSSLMEQPSQCFESSKNRKGHNSTQKPNNLWLTVLIIVLLMTLGLLSALFIYGRLIKKQMNQQMSVQVNRMVENYVSLEETKFSKNINLQEGSLKMAQS